MIRRCLVIHPGAVGDVLVALPALTHLGALGFERTLAATPRLTALLEGAGPVEAVTSFDGLGLHRLFDDEPSRAALDALRSWDAVVSWFGASDPAYRASLAGMGRPVVVARAAPPAGARIHASRHLVDTLRPLGPPPSAWPAARLTMDGEADRWATRWLAMRGLEPGEAVVLHPGAGSPAKAWPGFATLASRLREAGWPVVVSAGPADDAAVAPIVAGAGAGETRLARDLPLRRLAALLAAARAYVGNDSGPTHLAAAVGCPTVALFGPTDPAVWAPFGAWVVAGAGDAGDPWAGVSFERIEAALRRATAPTDRAGSVAAGMAP